jgi:hypothetical protein
VKTTGFGATIPRPVFYGLVVGSVAPLALVALFVPSELAALRGSGAPVAIASVVVFALPLFIWWQYAGEIAGPGGLYSFVEAAAGRTVARIQGAVWVVSYFLYLPSTVAQAVYDLLPSWFRLGGWRPVLELAIPVVLVAGVYLWQRGTFVIAALAAAASLPLAVTLAILEAVHGGVTFGAHAGVEQTARTTGSVSLLFVCASLPLYLGGELERPKVETRRALPVALAVAGVATLLAALPLAGVSPASLGATVPGAAIARSYGYEGLAGAVTIGVAVGVLTLVLLEYVALTRLLTAMTPLRPGGAQAWIGGAFLVSACLSLLGPDATYERLLKPSLVTLYAAELVVVAVYPLWRKRLGRLRPHDIVVALLAAALMVYGGLEAVAPRLLG